MTAGGVFITGTDTGVGKTVVTAVLAKLLRDRGFKAGVMKPVTSGCAVAGGKLISEDAELLKWASATRSPDADIAPYLLREPLAPSVSAAIDGVNIQFDAILHSFLRLTAANDFVLVEGAGGLMVPLTENRLVSDLIRVLDLPLIIVARPNLGTVNHTLMTCFCAKRMDIEVKGIIIGNYPENPGTAEVYAASMIEEFSGVPVLGVFPHIESENQKMQVEGIIGQMNASSAEKIISLAFAVR
ncbi:MAG TPA: dethiobiotin synthase [Geobacteraceae bacterium]|nr:dethiobiotin synthase [Geobacteraceae bacterium]